MKILITGGAGFIGSNLCAKLLYDGNEVFCFDNFYTSDKDNIVEFFGLKNFHFFEADIIEDIPKELLNIDFDQIYHLACPASPLKYQKDYIYTLRVNFEGTLRYLQFAKDIMERSSNNIKFLFTSTSEVYGDPLKSPQKEDYKGNVNPHGVRSCYDEGKRVAESLCMNFWRQYGLNVKIVRIFNTYGPKMDINDGRVVSNFIVQALKGEDLTVYGDGTQTRSFQYIDDLIEGIQKYMALDEDFPGPINLGHDYELSVLDFTNKVLGIIGSDSQIINKTLPKDDPVRRRPDISLAMEKLKWLPSTPLDEGLKKTIEYFKLVV